MSGTADTTSTTDGTSTGDPAGTSTTTTDPGTTTGTGEHELGDAGKRALVAERERAAAAERAAAELQRKLDALTEATASEAEKAVIKARKEGEQAATAKFVTKLAESAVRSAATGKFRDVTDAVDHLRGRLSEFVTADGDIDDKAVTAALDKLLKDKPHWAATGSNPGRLPASDAGDRNRSQGKYGPINDLLRQ